MSNIKLFEQKQVRSTWNEKDKKWYFSVIDVVAILTESTNPGRYWSDLKIQLAEKKRRIFSVVQKNRTTQIRSI
jgi:hypothetical protein